MANVKVNYLIVLTGTGAVVLLVFLLIQRIGTGGTVVKDRKQGQINEVFDNQQLSPKDRSIDGKDFVNHSEPKTPGWVKNGLNDGGGIVIPEEMRHETGISGPRATMAVSLLKEALERQGRAIKGSAERVEVYPEFLKNPEDKSLPFGPVFKIKGEPQMASQFEKQVHDEMKAIAMASDFEKFWGRMKEASAWDANLRGFGKYDLYIRFREEDQSNKIVVMRFALCEPGTMNIVSSREQQSINFGPFLDKVFSVGNIKN